MPPFPLGFSQLAVCAAVISLCLSLQIRAADLIVERFTNIRTVVNGTEIDYKYDYSSFTLSPDGTTTLITAVPNATYAIAAGSLDPEKVYIDAYTSVLASAQGGFTVETPLSASRPTPGLFNFLDWDTNFAKDFNYILLGGGEHSISSITPSYRRWLITLKPRARISVPAKIDFGSRPVNTRTRRQLTIDNTGDAPLKVRRITLPPGYSGSWSGIIEPGSNHTVTVTFRPTAKKRYPGKVVVSSNAYSGTYAVKVIGWGK
jgi:hypothetical protein